MIPFWTGSDKSFTRKPSSKRRRKTGRKINGRLQKKTLRKKGEVRERVGQKEIRQQKSLPKSGRLFAVRVRCHSHMEATLYVHYSTSFKRCYTIFAVHPHREEVTEWKLLSMALEPRSLPARGGRKAAFFGERLFVTYHQPKYAPLTMNY